MDFTDSLSAVCAVGVHDDAPPASDQTPAPPHTDKPLARADHPLLEAALNGLFRFTDYLYAHARLKQIHSLFDSILNETEPASLTLWVEDYAIDKGQANIGVAGNFACLSITMVEDHYSITAVKIHVPASSHPRRRKVKHTHPNWAHPVLRGAKHKQRYPSLELAQIALAEMHLEFPDTTIPGIGDKLYVMVYERKKKTGKGAAPVRKVILRIIPDDDDDTSGDTDSGSVIITCEDNPGKKKRPSGPSKGATSEAMAQAAAMVLGGATMG